MADTIQSQDLKKPRGTGFTNLSSYLQANQGNKLGQTVGSGIQKTGQQAQQSVQQAQQNFGQQSQQGRLGTQQDVQARDAVLNKIGDQQQGTDVGEQDVNAFQRYREGGYAGPQGLQDQQALISKAQEASQLGDLSRSAGGRQALLQRYVGAPNYGQGAQKLDTLLLGQGGNVGQIKQARQAVSGLPGEAQKAALGAQEQAKGFGSEAEDFKRGTVGRLGEILGQYDTALQGQVGEAKTLQEKQYNDLVNSGQIDNPELAESLGVTGDTQTYGADLKDLFSKKDIGLGDVASKSQAANLNALKKISGTSLDASDKADLLRQAEGFKGPATNLIAGDKDRFNTAVSTRKREYENLQKQGQTEQQQLSDAARDFRTAIEGLQGRNLGETIIKPTDQLPDLANKFAYLQSQKNAGIGIAPQEEALLNLYNEQLKPAQDRAMQTGENLKKFQSTFKTLKPTSKKKEA